MTTEEQKTYNEALRRIEECRIIGRKATHLDLRGLGLSTLPPEIGQLTALTDFHLYNNQLSTLPPEIGQLTALTVLYLHGNPLLALPPSVLGPEWTESKPHGDFDPAKPAEILDYYFKTRSNEAGGTAMTVERPV